MFDDTVLLCIVALSKDNLMQLCTNFCFLVQAIRRQKFERLRGRIADRLLSGKPEFLRGIQEISRLATSLTVI